MRAARGSNRVRPLGLFALIFALATSPGPARATTGGPITIEVLGSDAAGKTYWLEWFYDESGRNPQLWYVAAGDPVRVRSWYAHGAEDSGAFEQRLERLRRRLRRTPRTGVTVETAITARRARRIVPDLPPVRELQLRARLRAGDGERVLDVRAYRSARVRAFGWSLPDGRTLAVLRYVGIPHEGGYEMDLAVIVPGG